jgi:hypothetical protein
MAIRKQANAAEQYDYNAAMRDVLVETHQVLRALWREGETDILEGGVPAEKIAAETDTTPGVARDRLHELTDAGLARQLDGVDPENLTCRKSWRPEGGR